MDFHTKSYKSPDPEIPIQSLYIYVCINCVAQTVSLGCLCLYQWFVWQATHPVNTTNCMNEGRYLSVIIHLNQDLLSFIQSALISKYIYMYMKKLLDSDWQRTVQVLFILCNYNYKKYSLIGPESSLFKIKQSCATRKWCDLTGYMRSVARNLIVTTEPYQS